MDPRRGGEGRLERQRLADLLEADGEVSAYGAAIEDLHRRHQAHRLAGVVVFGDFVQNTGPQALPAAQRVDRPFYTVGIGPRQVNDLAVDMTTRNPLRKDEANDVTVRLRQTGLDGRSVRVQLYGRVYGDADTETDGRLLPLGEPKVVELTEERQTVVLPFQPKETGRFALEARAEPFDDEALEENNSVMREVFITDKSLQLLFIEYQPT